MMLGSPLRYPGGKAKLFPLFSELIHQNRLFSCEYCEPYAGGAGLAIRLVTGGFVERATINDIDEAVCSFWIAVFKKPDELCRLVERTPVTVVEWHRQRKIWKDGNRADTLALGFAFFFLNRTSRSGIVEGAGPIGGYKQSGSWKIDARTSKERLISNIRYLARYSRQIKVTNYDGLDFFLLRAKNRDAFIYLDPPYYIKGRKLYTNFYEPEDHFRIARTLRKHKKARWIVSYDDVPEIKVAYGGFNSLSYHLTYSAGEKSTGKEVLFCSKTIKLPQLERTKPLTFV